MWSRPQWFPVHCHDRFTLFFKVQPCSITSIPLQVGNICFFFFTFLLLDLQLGFLGVNSSLSALLATNFPAVLTGALALYTAFGSFAATGARLSGTCLDLSRAVLVATRRSCLVPFWAVTASPPSTSHYQILPFTLTPVPHSWSRRRWSCWCRNFSWIFFLLYNFYSGFW